jgi:hypothetical protein
MWSAIELYGDKGRGIKQSVEGYKGNTCPPELVTDTSWDKDAVPLEENGRFCEQHECSVAARPHVENLQVN